MDRYRIELSAKTADEPELREFVQQDCAGSGIGAPVTRASDRRSGRFQTNKQLEQLILNALQSGRPVRRKHLFGLAESKAQRTAIRSMLLELEQRGAIRKSRCGIFVLADAPNPLEEDLPPIDAAFRRSTETQILALLATPRTALELREKTRVSRQRVYKILSELSERGLVTRIEVTGERGRHVYIRTDVLARGVRLTRRSDLAQGQARALSALPAETICRVQTVAELVSRARQQLSPWFEQFSAQGLVTTFRLAQRCYVGLTARGYEHPQYDVAAAKASRADVIADFGPRRAMFLQVLFALGELKTIDVTRALPENVWDDVAYRSGQVVQRLQHSGLIEIVPGEARRPVSYRLTPKGRFAAAIFNRVQPMPSAAGLWAEMERHRERMRARKGFGPTGAWSPTQDAALRALREFGPLTRRQLDAAMDIKFKSGRSLNLALSQMAKRGLVRRARDAGGNLRTGSYVAPLWECAGNSEDSRESPTRVEDRQAQ